MAIKPKGKKVTGTAKADKITWLNSKLWQKSLTVNGLGGNDVINFKKSKYKNKLNGGAGNDKIYGGKKNDTIHGNAGNDLLVSGAGNDKLYGDSGKNTIKGGAGNDSIYAGKGNDQIWGGAGNDFIDLTKGGKNKVYGEAGNDTIKFGYSDNYIDGGDGNDYINPSAGSNTIKGGAGNDTIITGIGGSNNIDGGAGNDFIDGTHAGSSTMSGGTGNDTIYGNLYDDIINGGDGNDLLSGGGGVNILNGGAGNDTINISDGTNTINAGTNKNEIHFSNLISSDNTVLNGGGEDTLFFDNQTTFEGLFVHYVGNDLVFYNFGDITLKDFKNGHSAKYISINGDTRDISGLIGTDTNNIQFIQGSINVAGSNMALIGGNGADTINIVGSNNILIGGNGSDTYGFEWGYWNTEFTSNDIEHNTIVMGSDNVQDTIYIHTNQDNAGILCRKRGDDMVVWYKRQYYSGENPDADLYDGIYQIDGKDTYVYTGSRYYGSITIKDYFITENPTIDRIVMELDATHREYSIMSLFEAPQADLDNYDEYGVYTGSEEVIGIYDTENRTYTGTKYNEYIYTKRGTGDGDIVYGGAGNDTINTWGRTDSAYGEDGDDTIWGNSNCQIIDGGTGNDSISIRYAGGTNPQGYVKISGGEGSDVISTEGGGAIIYTNSEAGGKDTTEGVVDKVNISIVLSTGKTVYAQSETNIIVNDNDSSNDNYFAYSDQNTSISDAGGNDSLTVMNTAHTNLHVAFNVAKGGTSIINNSLWILDDTNYAKWQTNITDTTIVGINIKGEDISAIETLNANDNYSLSSTQLNTLQNAIAGWLGTDGRNYADVSAALASENRDTLITFIAANTNWQAPQ